MKLLFIDTETGGTDEYENSLLSIALVHWENKKTLDKLEIFIKEENYNTTKEAMNLNKLNLEEIKKVGLERDIAVKEINKFISKNFGDEKAIICGHNVNFDIRFLKQLYKKSNDDYKKYFSYRSLDTASIFKFLTLAGKFRNNSINSLDDAINYFKISFENRHSAMADIEKTIQVFNILIEKVENSNFYL